jgi:hypothetical protein
MGSAPIIGVKRDPAHPPQEQLVDEAEGRQVVAM